MDFGLFHNPWVRKIPWRRSWQSTPVFLPGESRSLVGYSLQGHKEEDGNLKVLHPWTFLKSYMLQILLFTLHL